jgi:hypothetical protein
MRGLTKRLEICKGFMLGPIERFILDIITTWQVQRCHSVTKLFGTIRLLTFLNTGRHNVMWWSYRNNSTPGHKC